MEDDFVIDENCRRLLERAAFITETALGQSHPGDNLIHARQKSAANFSASVSVDNPPNMSRGLGRSTVEDVNIAPQKSLSDERDFYPDNATPFQHEYDTHRSSLQSATTHTVTNTHLSTNSEHVSFPIAIHNHGVTSHSRDSVGCFVENETKTMEDIADSQRDHASFGIDSNVTTHSTSVDQRQFDLDLLSTETLSPEIPISITMGMESAQNHAAVSDCGYADLAASDPPSYDEPMMLPDQVSSDPVSMDYVPDELHSEFSQVLQDATSGISSETHQVFTSSAADISVPTTSDLANMMMSTDDISDFPLHSDNDSAHQLLDTCSLSSEVDLNQDNQPFHSISTGLFDSVQSSMMSCPSENDLESHHSTEAPPSELSNDVSNYLPDLGGDNSSTYAISEADPEDQLEPLSYDLQQGYRILREIMSESNKSIGWPFMHAVDDTLEGCQGYYDVVKQPMWLKKIRSRFDTRDYKTITEFVADMRVMLENCYRFNGPDHTISKKGQRLETMMEQKLALLSRDLREKTSIGATSGRPEENKRITGTRRRKAIVPHDSTALLNQLRLEAQEREREARRQLIQGRKQAQEAAQQELTDWEEDLMGGGLREQLKAMWEIPQIGHFLFLCAVPLNIGEVMHWELERCFLMPRESSTMQKVMTTLLSTPYQRTRLDRKPMMPYKVWEEKLGTRLKQWYKMLHDADNVVKKIIMKLGLEEKFFQVLGPVSPLEKKSYHELSFYQRVWIVKGLCDWCLDTQDVLREAIEAQPILEQREYDLGTDHEGNTYLHFPQFCGADLRIYRQAPPVIERKSPRRARSKSPKKTPARSRRRARRKTSPPSLPVTPRSRDGRLRQNPRPAGQYKAADSDSDTDATADDATTQQSSQTDHVTSNPESDLDTSGRDSGISEQDSDLDESRSQSSLGQRSTGSRTRSDRKDKRKEPAVDLDMLIGTTPARLTRSAMRNLTQAFSTNSTPSASRENSPGGSAKRGRKRPTSSLVSRASREPSPSVSSTRSEQKSRDASPVSKSRKTPSKGSARKKVSPRSSAVNLEEKFGTAGHARSEMCKDSSAVEKQSGKNSNEFGQGESSDKSLCGQKALAGKCETDAQENSLHCGSEPPTVDKHSNNIRLSPALELPRKESVDNPRVPLEESGRNMSTVIASEVSPTSRNRRESTGFTPLTQDGAASSSFSFIPIPPNDSPVSKMDDDESLASTISAVDPNYCPRSPLLKDKVNSPALSEDSTNLSGISDIREKPQSVLLGNVVRRLGDESSDTSECFRMCGAFKNVGPDEKSLTSLDSTENATSIKGDTRGDIMDFEASNQSANSEELTFKSSPVSECQGQALSQSAAPMDITDAPRDSSKSPLTGHSPPHSQGSDQTTSEKNVADAIQDSASVDAMDTSNPDSETNVAEDGSISKQLASLGTESSPVSAHSDQESRQQADGKSKKETSRLSEEKNIVKAEPVSDKRELNSETRETETGNSTSGLVDGTDTKTDVKGESAESSIKAKTVGSTGELQATTKDEVKDEATRENTIETKTDDEVKEETVEPKVEEDLLFEEVFPEIGPFELVVDNIDSLRALIAKFDEVEKTLQQQTMKPPAGRGAVTELRSRLVYLLEELEPWEQKLLSLGKKALTKMKKEQEIYEEEPEKEEIQDVWESEESTSGESAESEDESDSSAEVTQTKALASEVGVTTRGGAKRRKHRPAGGGKKPKVEVDGENHSPAMTPNILQKSRTSASTNVSRAALSNLKLSAEQAKGSAIAFIGNQPVLLQTNQLAELKNNNMFLAQLVNSQNQGLKLVGKQKMVGSQTGVALLAANTGASASTAGNAPMLLTTQNPTLFQQKHGNTPQKVQLKITSPVGKGQQAPKGTMPAKVMISGNQQMVLAGSQQLVLDSQGQLRVLQPTAAQQLVIAGAATTSTAVSASQQPAETSTTQKQQTAEGNQAGKHGQSSGQVQCFNYSNIRQLPVSLAQKLLQDQKSQQHQANTKPSVVANVTSSVATTTAVTPSAFTNLLQAGRLPGAGVGLLKSVTKQAVTETSSVQQALKSGPMAPNIMTVKSPIAISPSTNDSGTSSADVTDLTQSMKSSKSSRYATNVTVKTLLEKKIAHRQRKSESDTDQEPVEVIDLCHSPSRPATRETSPKPQPSTSTKHIRTPGILSPGSQTAGSRQEVIVMTTPKLLPPELSPASQQQQVVQAGITQQIQVVQGPGGQLMLQGAPPGAQVKFVQTPSGPKLQVFQNAPQIPQQVQLTPESTHSLVQGLIQQSVPKAAVTMAPVALSHLVAPTVVPATTPVLLSKLNPQTRSKVVVSQAAFSTSPMAAAARGGTKLVQVGNQGIIPLSPQVAAQLQVAIAKKRIVDNAVKAVITSVTTSLPTANIKISSPFQMPSRRSHRPITNTTSAMKVPIPAVPSQPIPLTSQATSLSVTAGQTTCMSSMITPTASVTMATTMASVMEADGTPVVDLTDSDLPMDTSESRVVSSQQHMTSKLALSNLEVTSSSDLTMPIIPQAPMGHLTTAVSALPGPIVTPKVNTQLSPGQPKNMGLRLTPQSILTPGGTVHGVVVPHGVALSQPIIQQLKKISKVQGLAVFQQTVGGSLQQVFAGTKVVGAQPVRPELLQNLKKTASGVTEAKPEAARSITFTTPDVPKEGIRQQAATGLNHTGQPSKVVHHQVGQYASSAVNTSGKVGEPVQQQGANLMTPTVTLGQTVMHLNTAPVQGTPEQTSQVQQPSTLMKHRPTNVPAGLQFATVKADNSIQPVTNIQVTNPTVAAEQRAAQELTVDQQVMLASAALQQAQIRTTLASTAVQSRHVSPSAATIVQQRLGSQQPVLLQPVQQSAILQQLQQAVRVSQPSVIQALTPTSQKQVLLQPMAIQTQYQASQVVSGAAAVPQIAQPAVAIQHNLQNVAATPETRSGLLIPQIVQEKAALLGSQIVRLPSGQQLVQINQLGQQLQLAQAAPVVHARQQTQAQQVTQIPHTPVQPAQVRPVVLAAANAQTLLQQAQAVQVTLPASVASAPTNSLVASTLIQSITTQSLTQQQMIQLLQAQQKQIPNVQNTSEQQPTPNVSTVASLQNVVTSPVATPQPMKSLTTPQTPNAPAKLVVFNVNGKLMTAQGVPVNLTQGLVKVGNQVIGAQAGISRTTVVAPTSSVSTVPSTATPTRGVTRDQPTGGLQMLANAAGIESPPPMENRLAGAPSGLEVLASVANNKAMGLPQD